MPDLPVSKKIERLSKTDLFSLCSSSELRVIAANSSFMSASGGKTIFSPDNTANSLFIVEKGEIVIRKTDNENRLIDIARFLPGDCFGELDMLTGSARNAFAFAEIDSRLLVFPKKGLLFSDFLEKYPELSARILHKFIVQISGRIRKTNTLVKENSPLIQELSRQVYVDKLTGLYNKTCFEEKVKDKLDSLSGGKNKTEKVSLLMFKPDNFKEINDTHGHEAGDLSLIIMAKEISSFLPEEGVLFRYMGNELAVLLPGYGREKAFETAGKLLDFIHRIDLKKATGGKGFQLSASFGISVFPEHARTSHELIQKAHELPLAGRAQGGNRILFPEDIGKVKA